MQKAPLCPLPKEFSKGKPSDRKNVTIDYSKEGEFGRENLYRRYPRAPLEVEAIVHNQDKLFWGSNTDISEKGCYIYLNPDSTLKTGDEVVLLGDDSEEDDWWLMLASMFAGPMSGFIVFGSIITGTSQEMITGKPSYGGSSLTPFAGVADDFKALGMMTRGILTADMEEFTKQLDKLLSSLVAPYREGKKYMKNN